MEPALISQLTQNSSTRATAPARALATASSCWALAAGFVGAGYVIEGLDADGDALRDMKIPAVILGTVGLAYLLLAVVDYATKKRNAA